MYYLSVVEDGVLYMQPVPKYWGVDDATVGADLVDLLQFCAKQYATI